MLSLGLAIDIGTTNLVMRMVDLKTGEVIDEVRDANPQGAFGADVTSRIVAAHDDLARMGDLVGDALAGMAFELTESLRAVEGHVERVSMCGNTAMQCIAFGIDPESLGVAPYTVPDYFGDLRRYERFELEHIFDGEAYVAPCVGPYVGGDITAGLLACGLPCEGERVLFIDLGTNGEMTLAADGVITCCSVSAGPVFEGVDGLRGTELIDAAAHALETGLIDETGRIDNVNSCPGKFHILTQEHVRALQLAKAAVCAGIRVLLVERGLKVDDIDSVLIAGVMGGFLDVQSAATIGLIPRELAGRARAVGNTAIEGARMLLVDSARDEMRRVLDACEYLELSGDRRFNARFVNELEFPSVG